jgi:hypothetical protein
VREAGRGHQPGCLPGSARAVVLSPVELTSPPDDPTPSGPHAATLKVVIITTRHIARIMYAFMYLPQRLGEPDRPRSHGESLVPGSIYPQDQSRGYRDLWPFRCPAVRLSFAPWAMHEG